MSVYNRYNFTKEVHPNYLVLLSKKGKYYSYGTELAIELGQVDGSSSNPYRISIG